MLYVYLPFASFAVVSTPAFRDSALRNSEEIRNMCFDRFKNNIIWILFSFWIWMDSLLSHSTVMLSLSRAFFHTPFGSLTLATALENKQNSILAYLCEFHTIIFFIFSVSIILLTNYDDERLSSFICLSTVYSSTNVCGRGFLFYLELELENCNKFNPSPFERRNMKMIARQKRIFCNSIQQFISIPCYYDNLHND